MNFVVNANYFNYYNIEINWETQRERVRERGMKTKSVRKDEIPFGIKLTVNMCITFGLSLSMYLLFANLLLTFHNISLHTPYLRLDEYAHAINEQQIKLMPIKKYYDCAKGILSAEECDTINRYHESYLNLVKVKLLSSSGGSSDDASPTLKVNTSFFTR